MERRMLKFELLKRANSNIVEMQLNALIMPGCVHIVGGTVCLYAMADLSESRIPVEVFVAATGQVLPANAAYYCGTVVERLRTGDYVWHVWVCTSAKMQVTRLSDMVGQIQQN